MKLSTELGDEYVNTVLSNLSLNDLSNEEWKLVEGFENYAVSNYGRIKSLERCVINSYGGEHQLLDIIMKLQVTRYYNNLKIKNPDFQLKC
ncbi:NUMOD4 domain-containing protein [Chryseobacterium sp. MYb264]|uniref:NUMOD4 domain-containing protein n=1 Tax=Chryseobacterium sp. MYb264 TaxID=2745153 RepID=UPI002E1074B7|nr:NUMOD4 domain-containing protein [Chryseobacterium sp. MYb264]